MPLRYANLIALLAVLAVGLGCQGSRWARSDPKYAAKYPVHTNNVVRMAKQASDARHVAGRSGDYASVVAGVNPFAVGGQLGVFHYPEHLDGAVEARVAFTGLAFEGDPTFTGGIDAGLRVQTPTRLATFAGTGVYVGATPNTFDDDSDEDGEFLAAAYPEVGAHVWLNSRWRLTAFARYFVTTDGRDTDGPVFGVTLASLDIPSSRPRPKPYRVECADVAPSGQSARIEPADDQPLRLPAIASEQPWPSEPWAPPVNPR